MTFESYSNDVEVMKGRLLGWLDELFVNLDSVETKASEEHGTVLLKIPAGRLIIHVLATCNQKGTWTMLSTLGDKQGRARDGGGVNDISRFALAVILIHAYQKALECGAEEKE